MAHPNLMSLSARARRILTSRYGADLNGLKRDEIAAIDIFKIDGCGRKTTREIFKWIGRADIANSMFGPDIEERERRKARRLEIAQLCEGVQVSKSELKKIEADLDKRRNRMILAAKKRAVRELRRKEEKR